MTEQEKETCRWESEYDPEYTCDEPSLVGGYCILHAKDENKDLDSFKRKVEEKLHVEGDRIHLEGCYFPSAFDKEHFKECNFNKIIYFNEATFSQGTNFLGADFLYVDFSEAKFSGDVNFVGVRFNVSPDFEGAAFAGTADFQSFFKQDANFKNAKFHKANFSGADFCGTAEFSESHFEGEANFTGVIFKETCEKADFKDVVFNSEVNFSGSYCQDTKVDFTGSTFKGRTLFTSYFPAGPTQEVELGQVVFNNVNFLEQTVFQHVNLSRCSFLHSNIDQVDFRYCTFNEKKEKLFGIFPHHRQNVLRDELEADGEVEKDPSDKDKGFFASLRMTGSAFREEKYEPVRRLYLELKRNFEDKKDWNTAGDFHYGEMECRRKGRLGGWLDRFLVNVYYLASGYGERPLRAFVALAILVLFAFPILLSLNEWYQPFWLRDYLYVFWASFKDSLEVATFVRFTRIVEPVKPENPWDTCFLVIESITVYIQIALFAMALRRKVKR